VALAYLVKQEHLQITPAAAVVKAQDMAVLEDARAVLEQCEAVTEQVRQEGERAYAEQRARGFEHGVEQGYAQCARQLADTEAAAARYLAALDSKLVALVIAVVKKLAPKIGAERFVADLIAQAIKEAKSERFLLVKVHPDNRECVARRLAEMKQGQPMVEFFDVVADPQLDGFSCVLESEAGVVKAGLNAQLQVIEEAMQRSLAGAVIDFGEHAPREDAA
jgi:type III secretion system HrpE/YscL family protein